MAQPTVVGIHLCGMVMRRAELRPSGHLIRIVTAQQPLPEGGHVDVQPASVSATSGQSDVTSYVVSIPTSDVMSRCWRFPDADDAKFRQMVAHRLEAELPVPIDQLTWGYRKDGRRSAPDGRRRVLAQAARTRQVARTMALLSAAGVPVDTLTTEAQALGALYRHALEDATGEGSEVLVLARPDDWLVAVLSDGMVHSVRRLHVEPGRLELTCRQCQQSIEAQLSRRELRRVLWCAPPELADARDVLADQLGVVVQPVVPAARLVDAGAARLTVDELATFGPAIGLALAGFFEPERIIRLAGRDETKVKPRRRSLRHILSHPWRWTATAATLAILAAALHVGALRWEARRMQALLSEVEQAGSPLTTLQPKIRAMQRLETYRIDVEGVVADLCRSIPNSIVISSIQFSRERRLVIKGTAKNPKDIFALADALRKGERFAVVNPERTEPAQGGGFTISAELVGVNGLPSSVARGGSWH